MKKMRKHVDGDDDEKEDDDDILGDPGSSSPM